ncbi:MAG: XRE family transcriptional regulator [Lachnospiraceae bacterium]|nr:XRE family transcriptional regulator [Lachnospiraceae bacterium]
MSFISTVINHRYYSDIIEASNGFFLTVADEIDLHKITNLVKFSPNIKFKVCERFGICKGKDTNEIDAYFSSFKKLNQYSIKDEVSKYLKVPKINRVLNIYGNRKIINCDLEMKIDIDTSSMLSNLFYQVLNPYKQMSVIEREDSKLKTLTYYIKASFVVDGIFKEFKVLDVVRDMPEARVPKDGIRLSASLVPVIKSVDLPYYVNRFMNKYDIDGIVDIDDVVDKMGLTIIDAFTLKPVKGNRIKGLVCISNGTVEVEECTLNVHEGTILIDKSLKDKSLGSYRFVVLHECVHYDLHKEFLTVRKQLMDINAECSNYETDTPRAIIDDIIKNDNQYSCESKVEWQANNIAGRVLVPSEMLVSELSKKYEEYDYFNSDNKENILRVIASDLAELFGASKEEICIRIKQVSFFTNDIDLAPYETPTLFPEEKEEIYNTDVTFRQLIDDNKVVYVDNRCVINNNKYFNNGAITFYGRRHPNESMIFFKKNTNYDSYADDELYYVKPTKKLVDNINLSFKDSDLKDDIDEFTKLVTNESKFDDYNKTDLKDTLINIMKSRKLTLSAIAERTGLSKSSLNNLLNSRTSKNIYVPTLIVFLHTAGVPVGNAKRLISKAIGNFEENYKNKIMEFTMDKYYSLDDFEFCEKINEMNKAGEAIDKKAEELLYEEVDFESLK